MKPNIKELIQKYLKAFDSSSIMNRLRFLFPDYNRFLTKYAKSGLIMEILGDTP